MKKLLKTLLLLLIIGGLGFWGYNAVINKQININHWFVGGMTRGADISSYQGKVDMIKLKSHNIDFLYIKATEGATHKDAQFLESWQSAGEADLPAGAYHYFSYNESGANQAENFVSVVGELGDGRLIPAVDLELSSSEKDNPPEKSDVVASLKVFLAVLEEKYKVKPLIYCTKDYYDKYLKDDFADYPRWVRSVWWPVFVEAGSDWLVWQYDDHAELDGYNGSEKYIDLNVINKEKGLDALKY